MDGKYTLRIIVNGVSHLYHGSEQLAFADSRQTLTIANASVMLRKGEPYNVSIHYKKVPGDLAVRLEWELGGSLPYVPAVLEAWYPGMEEGIAISNIIFGKVNPSGKLPFSWPKKLTDAP